MSTLTSPLNFDNYTFRCSSVGKLMTKPRGKSPMQRYEECLSGILDLESKSKIKALTKIQLEKLERLKQSKQTLYDNRNNIFLSTTAISYLLEIYCCVRDGIKKDITNKYLEKGIAVEDDAIALLSEFHDELYSKYEGNRMHNEFIEGTCDILYPEHAPKIVIDNKSCWSRFQFQVHSLEKINQQEDETENNDQPQKTEDSNQPQEIDSYGGDSTNGKINKLIYEYQGIGYCELYGVSLFKLCYTLMNMPEELIADEFQRILWIYGKKNQDSELYQLACAEFLKQCKFDNLPISERVVEFTVKQDSEKYTAMVEQIKTARKWLNWYSIKEWERVNKRKWIIEPIEHNIDLPMSEIKFVPAEEFVFPNDLDKIEPSEEIIEMLDSSINDMVNTCIENEDEVIILIKSLSTREDCIKYFEDNEEFLEENPQYIKIFNEHKKSLATQVIPNQSKAKSSSAKSSASKINAGNQSSGGGSAVPIPPKSVWTPPTQSNNSEDTIALEKLWNIFITFEKASDVKVLYRSNMELIDRNLAFRDKITALGTKLYADEVEKIKKEVENEVLNS